MRVYVQSLLPCQPDRAWEAVQTSALLLEVARPLIVICGTSEGPLPEQWQQGASVRCRTYLFGLIPLGVRSLVFERVDQEAHTIQTREQDAWIRRWDHCIRVQPAENGGTLYSDEIEIEAGLLTPLVWLFAWGFYRHRQRRWRAVARRLQSRA